MANSARENYWLPLAFQDERCRALSCQVWRSSGGGETAFMEAPSKTPCLWRGGGSPRVLGSGWGRLSPGAQQQGHGAGHRQHGRLGTALPSARLREGRRLPWGRVAGCHQELERKKWLLCVFSTVVEFYGIALLFLQHWL